MVWGAGKFVVKTARVYRVKRKRGRPAKQSTVKLDETVETASTSAEHSCGKSYAAKRGRRTKPMLTPTIKAKAVTLEELQKADGGWFTIKPAVTIVALFWDRYSYHRCVECRTRAFRTPKGNMVALNTPLRRQRQSTACVSYCDKTTLICGSLLSPMSPS